MHRSFNALHGPPPEAVAEADLLHDEWKQVNPDHGKATGELKQIAKQAFKLASEARQQIFEDCHAHLAGAMDAHFRGARAALRTALAKQDGNLFWKLFWHSVESSVAQFTSHSQDGNEHRHLGRGSVRVRSEMQQPLFASHLKGNCERPLP